MFSAGVAHTGPGGMRIGIGSSATTRGSDASASLAANPHGVSSGPGSATGVIGKKGAGSALSPPLGSPPLAPAVQWVRIEVTDVGIVAFV